MDSVVKGVDPVLLVAHLDTVQPPRYSHSQQLLPKELDSLKFIIELDRKGKNDAVFYDCVNSDFETYIIGKGFKTARGSFPDISLIAAVNLSCGYYNAHSLHEFSEHIQPISEPLKFVRHDESVSLPRTIPAELQDIYDILLDFYSPAEIESFREEFGDHILWQIYHDEIVPLYFR